MQQLHMTDEEIAIVRVKAVLINVAKAKVSQEIYNQFEAAALNVISELTAMDRPEEQSTNKPLKDYTIEDALRESAKCFALICVDGQIKDIRYEGAEDNGRS